MFTEDAALSAPAGLLRWKTRFLEQAGVPTWMPKAAMSRRRFFSCSVCGKRSIVGTSWVSINLPGLMFVVV